MARTPNYDFEKRRKELERKAKKEGRREEKRLRRERGETGEGDAPLDAAADGSEVPLDGEPGEP